MTRTFPLTPTTLARHLRSVSEEEFAEFVADVWENLGWETSLQGSVVTATRENPRSETKRIRVFSDNRSWIARLFGCHRTLPSLSEYDALVVGYRTDRSLQNTEFDADVSLIDINDLYYRLLYGMDRSTCRSLCYQHFGRTGDPVAPPEQDRAGRRVHRFVTRLQSTRWRVVSAVVIGVVVAVLAVGIFTMGGDPTIDHDGGRIPPKVQLVTPVGAERTPQEGSVVSATPTSALQSGILTATTITDGTSTQSRFYSPIFENRTTYADLASKPLICHNSSKGAIVTFVWSVDKSNEIGRETLRVARNVTAPAYRIPLEALAVAVTNGSLQGLREFDQISFGRPPQFPSFNSNMTTHYLSVFGGGNEDVYGFEVVPRNASRISSPKLGFKEGESRSGRPESRNQTSRFTSSTDRCWLLSQVILLDVYSSD